MIAKQSKIAPSAPTHLQKPAVVPFPIDCLPTQLAKSANEVAEYYDCSVDLVAVSMLSVAEAAIGNSRILWTFILQRETNANGGSSNRQKLTLVQTEFAPHQIYSHQPNTFGLSSPLFYLVTTTAEQARLTNNTIQLHCVLDRHRFGDLFSKRGETLV